MASTIQFDDARVRLGLFLEACGRALQQPTATSGELRSECMFIEGYDLEHNPHNPGIRLKLNLQGIARLANVPCDLPDGGKLTFPNVAIEALQIRAALLPTLSDEMVTFFGFKPREECCSSITGHWKNPETNTCYCGALIYNGNQISLRRAEPTADNPVTVPRG